MNRSTEFGTVPIYRRYEVPIFDGSAAHTAHLDRALCYNRDSKEKLAYASYNVIMNVSIKDSVLTFLTFGEFSLPFVNDCYLLKFDARSKHLQTVTYCPVDTETDTLLFAYTETPKLVSKGLILPMAERVVTTKLYSGITPSLKLMDSKPLEYPDIILAKSVCRKGKKYTKELHNLFIRFALKISGKEYRQDLTMLDFYRAICYYYDYKLPRQNDTFSSELKKLFFTEYQISKKKAKGTILTIIKSKRI